MLLDRARQRFRANAPTEARELLESAHELIAVDDAQTAALVTARPRGARLARRSPTECRRPAGAGARGALGSRVGGAARGGRGQLGRFLILSGEFERGAVYVEQALGIAELLDLPEVLSAFAQQQGHDRRQRRSPERGPHPAEGALAIALEHDLHAAALRAYNNLGWALDTATGSARQTT